MIEAVLTSHTDFEKWREIARGLCATWVEPEEVTWIGPDTPRALFAGSTLARREPRRDSHEDRAVTASTAFVEMARRVMCHRDPERFARLYVVLCRLQDDRNLLGRTVEDDVIWLRDRDKAIRRDEHKMHAFVRFRKVGEGTCPDGGDREAYAAWFEPEHRIVELAAPFFVRRFTGMDWAILTPDRSAKWEAGKLTFGPGGSRDQVPAQDAVEDQWRTYFASIFNPARLKVAAMKREMPMKYWRNLPEAPLIPSMIAGSQARADTMRDNSVTPPNTLAGLLKDRNSALPDFGSPTLSTLKAHADACRRCPLYKDATQSVVGEGPASARLMLVGEQPGDQEDIAGWPFVGPAGKLLDGALEEAGVDRAKTYVTNAVKHFKFEPRGKRRIHSRPNAGEIDACRWWLDLERSMIMPDVILGLGASAARSLLGRTASLASLRGQDHPSDDGAVIRITVHPSYLLRLPDEEARAREYARFVEDLRSAAARLAG